MEKIVRVSGFNFFLFQLSIKNFEDKILDNKKYLIPDFSEYTPSENPLHLYAAYKDKGLYFRFSFDFPFTVCNQTDFRKGDSIEVFIDTRDNKEVQSITKFCHHFIFFPDTQTGKEITRFRLEDRHDFCDEKALEIKSFFSNNSFSADLFIPSYCLTGYDPDQYSRVGFCYRVNRMGKEPLFFNVLPEEYSLEQNPSLWGSLILEKD